MPFLGWWVGPDPFLPYSLTLSLPTQACRLLVSPRDPPPGYKIPVQNPCTKSPGLADLAKVVPSSFSPPKPNVGFSFSFKSSQNFAKFLAKNPATFEPRTCTPRASCTGTADFAESWKSDLSPRRPQIHAFFLGWWVGPDPFPPYSISTLCSWVVLSL